MTHPCHLSSYRFLARQRFGLPAALLLIGCLGAAVSAGASGLLVEPEQADETGGRAAVAVFHDALAQGPVVNLAGSFRVELSRLRASEPPAARDRLLDAPRGPDGRAAEFFSGGQAKPGLPEPRWPRQDIGSERSIGEVCTSFDGLSGGDREPLDTAIAVGPGSVLQAGEEHFRLFDTTGAALTGPVRYEDFLSGLLPPGWAGAFFSPRALYTPEHQRFVLLISGVDHAQRTSFFFLAVSVSSDPVADWSVYRFDARQPDSDAWIGETGLGVDTWGVYVTANMYTWNDNTFRWATLWSFDTEVLRQGVAAGWTFWDLRWPDDSLAFGLLPARPHTVSSEQTSFFVNTRPEAGDQLGLWRLTGDRALPSLSRVAIDTSPYQAIGEQVVQPGSPLAIDGGDARVAGAVYAFRRVYAVWTTDPGLDGRSSAVLSVRVNTNTERVASSDLLHGGEGWYYFYPALTVLGGDGTQLSTGMFLNAVHRTDLPFSAAAYVDDIEGEDRFELVTVGSGPYLNPAGGRTLSGSINGAAYDWSSPGRMWGSTQYAGAVASRSRITAVAMDDEASCEIEPPPCPEVCLPDATTACLLQGRFRLRATWRDFQGLTGNGRLTSFGTDRSVLFWFFDGDNWEVLAKMVDGCGLNQHFWFLGAATTNVEYTLTLTDTWTCEVRTYHNQLGTAAPAITDTTAFSCS